MESKFTFRVIAVVCTISSLLAATSTMARSDDTEAKPLVLRKIMRELGQNMQIITDGISRKEWDLVAKTALQVANHPQPPMVEKIRILSFVGTDVGKFKGYDNKIHQAAVEVSRAAVQKDGPVVISSFAKLRNSCLACHQNFREPIKEHFYVKL